MPVILAPLDAPEPVGDQATSPRSIDGGGTARHQSDGPGRYYVVELIEPADRLWPDLSRKLADEATLEEAVLNRLQVQGLDVTTAESCTGGALGAALTEPPGSSEVYLGGVVSYSYEMKERLLGVERKTLESHGAVSPECVAEMVRGCEERLGGAVQIAVTGIAGPGGGTPEKPVGLVYMALRRDGSEEVFEFRFPGRRHEVRKRSVEAALLLLLDANVAETIGGRRLTAR